MVSVGDVELVGLVAGVRLRLAQVVRQAGRAQDRAGDARAPCSRSGRGSRRRRCAPSRSCCRSSSFSVSGQPLGQQLEQVADPVDGTGRQVLRRRRRDGCSAWFIRRPVIISKMSRISSRSRKPKVIAVSAPSSMPPVASATRWEEIRLSSIIITRMTLARSGIWSVDAEQPLDAADVGVLVEQRRQVVHPRHERDALGPGAVLAVLLDAGVQVADAEPALGDGLAVELEDQPEHAVRRRVLRTHVDDDPLLGRLAEALPSSVSQSWPVTV